ncbi:hypothetical protein TRFO_12145 [Tritrichomonas foetus]|uniref:UDENN domain-containing protein n=1 Tax=Tritrichomonas foetus TaxID=1144522 RepID=A0A1J4J2J7_9EUKA|nr:hypothetical protein TRFO_12145 [Tritrichomonas foetus]|eukprot:OHS92961.1 hypothetical protein TRFO_12145 [Tritrichomonas foetus]
MMILNFLSTYLVFYENEMFFHKKLPFRLFFQMIQGIRPYPSCSKIPLNNPRIQQRIEQRRKFHETFNSSMIFRTESNNRKVFKHFLIFGAPPNIENEDDVKPELLFVYPSNELIFSLADIPIIQNFCFPNGFKRSNKEFSTNNTVSTEFIMFLSGSNLYGVCSHCLVNPQRIPFFASEKSAKYPFCYCMLTKYPIFSVQFEFLFYFARLIDRIVDPAGARIFIEEKTILNEDNNFENLTQRHNFAYWKGTHLPHTIKMELYSMYNVYKQTSEEFGVQIDLSNDIKVLVPPWLDFNEYIACSTFDILFSLMSVSDIVRIFTAVLLECQTIFYSENLNTVTLSVLAIKALLHPFEINNALLPILYESMYDLINSPCPYIYGISELPPDFEVSEGQVFVNLDKGTVESDCIIQLPDNEAFIKEISNVLEQYSKYISVPSVNNHRKYIKFIKNAHVYSRPLHSLLMYPTKYLIHPKVARKIIKIFSKKVYGGLEDLIKPYFVTDTTDPQNPVSIFDLDFFLSKGVHPFYAAFSNSTFFNSFVDDLTDKMMDEKSLRNL